MVGAIKIHCIGWIPSISGDIFLFEPFIHSTAIPDVKEFYINDYEQKISRDFLEKINQYEIRFVNNSVKMSDEECDRNELSIFIYLLEDGGDHKHLKEVLVFQENGALLNFVGHVEIECIEKRGIIKFHSVRFCFDNDKLEEAFINQIFVNIKELYHKHTHHDGNAAVADRLLPVCLTADDATGKMAILRQFQKKIIFYNTEIKNYFVYAKKSKTYDPSEALHGVIRQAKGEFLYALNFIKFYRESFGTDADVYETIFKNEISSIEAYSSEAESEYGLWLTKRIGLLTWILILLTLILILVTMICAPLKDSIFSEIIKIIHPV